jgi:streptogramin lyase
MTTRRHCAAMLVAVFALAGCQGSATTHMTPTTVPGSKSPGKGQKKPHTVVSNQCLPPPGQTVGTITEYTAPGTGTQPFWLVADQSGHLWVTEYNAAALAKFNIGAASWSTYSTPTSASEPAGVTIASDGNPWLVEFGKGKIAKFDTSSSTFTEYGFSGGAASLPYSIDNSTVAATAGMWVTLNGNTQVANVATSGSIVYHTAINRPYGLSIDTRGNVWYTTYNNNQVFEGKPTPPSPTWTIPTSGSQPANVTEGPSGTGMWLTEYHGNKIANVDPSGTLTEYTIPTSASAPLGIVSACGNIWFAESAGNKIGEINPYTGAITEYSVPTSSSGPTGVAVDANGNVWFTERNSNKIGMITTVGAAATVPDGEIYALNSSGGSIVNYAAGNYVPPPAGILTSFPGASWDTNGGMAFDSSGNLWVVGNGYVAEYAPGATGSAAPLTSFTIAQTGAHWLVVDSSGEILIPDPSTQAIYAYSPTSSGLATPIRTIAGAATDLDAPYRIAIDGSDNIWVDNPTNLSVQEFPASANGNVAPTIDLDPSWASSNGIGGLSSIALDSSGNLIVLANDGENVFRFTAPVTASSHFSSEFNTYTIPGGPSGMTDIALDDEGYIYGPTIGGGIEIYSPTASGNVQPYAWIASSNDGLMTDPFSIAIWSNPSWWFGGDARHHAKHTRPHARLGHPAP